MDNEEIHIQIAILNRPIDLWIKEEHEWYYREAEKRINEKAINFAKRWNYTDNQDLLSKLLLNQTVNYIAKEEKLKNYEDSLMPKMDRLCRLVELADEAIGALDKEEADTSAQNVD